MATFRVSIAALALHVSAGQDLFLAAHAKVNTGANATVPTLVPETISPGSAGHSDSHLDATTLHWNSHRPCATYDWHCYTHAQQRLGEMAKQVGAQIVGAVELKDGHTALPHWQSTGQQCDWSTIMVAPGWHISKSGGGCSGGDQAKGFAVALVVPPHAVHGCPMLCIFMGHVPHPGQKLDGHGEIHTVCGGLEQGCMVGMGDWNREWINDAWKILTWSSPTLVEPHDKTCCYPHFNVAYDHTATNIAGAWSAGRTVFDPQLTQFKDNYFEHKPTSVQLKLPLASTDSEASPGPAVQDIIV